MYVQKITLKNLSPYPTVHFADDFYWLISAFRKSGQIQNGINTQFVDGNYLTAFVYTLEKSALSMQHATDMVKEQIKRLEKFTESIIEYGIVGFEYTNKIDYCTCDKPESYTLTPLFLSKESSIFCNSCKLSVPLYRLPKFETGDYEPLLNWNISSMCISGIEISNLHNDEYPEIPLVLLEAQNKIVGNICTHITTNTGIKVFTLSPELQSQNGKVDFDTLEMAD